MAGALAGSAWRARCSRAAQPRAGVGSALGWERDRAAARRESLDLHVVGLASGVGMTAFAKSVAVVCASPWQTEHSTPFWLYVLTCQSLTMFAVIFLWHSTRPVAGW